MYFPHLEISVSLSDRKKRGPVMYLTVPRYVEVGELTGNESIGRLAGKLAPCYARAKWPWVLFGIPDANALATRIEHLMASCIGGWIESGGLRVERSDGRLDLMADRKLNPPGAHMLYPV